ncbi:MAG: efflux RND transporter periplasmic adaptor subunit [Propionibacteriaceae bacterium]|jgi:HlyD family secretion protein|nr:efflux RND transporter periplasmic adaptor subunit [Propionibacteriaceae bacterium]
MAEGSRKRHLIGVFVVVVVVLVAVSAWLYQVLGNPAAAEPAVVGTVEANQYQIAALISGRVTEVLVAEGDQVDEKDPLVKLDASAASLALQQAEQEVVAAEANVDKAKNSSAADRKVAQARLKQAEAAVELAQLQVDNAQLNAPTAGRVTAILTNVGANAAPGKTLLTLLDTGNLYLRAYVPETEAGKLKVDQEVSVIVQSQSDPITGKISYIAAEPEFTPNTAQTAEQRAKLVYEVRIGQLGAAELKPGMFVEIKF